MIDFLFDTTGFPPRWECGAAWAEEPWLGWVHIVSDIATAIAYVAIPVLMLFAIRRARHVPAPRLMTLFAIFILACGTVHLFEAVIFWSPIYKLSAVAKVVTAISSGMTACVLMLYLPKLLEYRSPEELQSEVERQTEQLADTASRLNAATAKLEEQKERLSLALAAGQMGAWAWEIDSGVLRFDENEVELTGLVGQYDVETGETLLQLEDFFKIVHPDDRDGLREALRPAVEDGESYGHEFRITTPDGDAKWLSGRGHLIVEPGSPNRLVGVNYDITAQKRTEAELAEAKLSAEAANDAKSRFLANTSHEIRTPLTAILGCADTIVRDTQDSDTRDAASLIHRQGKLLQQLLDDVLDLSKIEAGRLTVRRDSVCDTLGLVEDLRSLMQPLAIEKGLSFSVDRSEAIPRYVQTDPIRLRQVMINLVSNAIKFTKRGEVRISVDTRPVEEGNGEVVFAVEDTGVGIPLREQKAIFEAFHQANAEQTPTESHSINLGAGLGLAISRRMSKLLGGRLELQSEPGVGSKFTVRLPLRKPNKVQVAAFKQRQSLTDPDAQGTPLAKRRGRILVAEDTPSIQFLLKRFLNDHATELEFVSDGQSAIEQVTTAVEAGAPYDLLVLDMHMPIMSGYEAARQIRDMGSTIPIIALTASAMVGDRERCLAAGCSSYLPKPIDAGALELEVQRLFAENGGSSTGDSGRGTP